MDPPPLSPVLAPRGSRKRRHSSLGASDDERVPSLKFRGQSPGTAHESPAVTVNDAEDATDDSSDTGLDTQRPSIPHDRHIDDDASVTSSVEDLLDNAEMNPYAPFIDGEKGLSDAEIERLRSRLLDIGPDDFIDEMLHSGKIHPRTLGIAFGIDPSRNLVADDQRYLHVLAMAITRTFYKRRKLTQYNTIDDAAALLQRCKKVMVITGAGISTSLGIPDFRSKVGGFYSNLIKEGYEDPESVFDIETFDWDPTLFYKLARDILPDMKRVSPTHAFIRLLQDKGKLQRNYTQNIDALEQLAGIREDLLVQCHGSFATATCRKNLTHKVKGADIYDDIRAQRVPYCASCKEILSEPKRKPASKSSRRRRGFDDSSSDTDDDMAPGVLKPDIVFFGQPLADDFFERFTEDDAHEVDLVLVIGTSLKVAPVSEMPHHLPKQVPHIYVSREPCAHVAFDIQLLGDCDDVVFELARRAGWDLVHDMVPSGFRTQVESYDGSGHSWRVIPDKMNEQPRTTDLAKVDLATPNPVAKQAVAPASSREKNGLPKPVRLHAAPNLVRPASPASPAGQVSVKPPSRTASPKPTSLKPSVSSGPPSRGPSPSRPAFRPIPGSPARRADSQPTPPPQTMRPVPGSRTSSTTQVPVVPRMVTTLPPRSSTPVKNNAPTSAAAGSKAPSSQPASKAAPPQKGPQTPRPSTPSGQTANGTAARADPPQMLMRPAQLEALPFLSREQKQDGKARLVELWRRFDDLPFGSEKAREAEGRIRRFTEKMIDGRAGQ